MGLMAELSLPSLMSQQKYTNYDNGNLLYWYKLTGSSMITRFKQLRTHGPFYSNHTTAAGYDTHCHTLLLNFYIYISYVHLCYA